MNSQLSIACRASESHKLPRHRLRFRDPACTRGLLVLEHTMYSASKCDTPIVLRATTLDYVPPSVARLAERTAQLQDLPVFVIGCRTSRRRNLIGSGVNLKTVRTYQELIDRWNAKVGGDRLPQLIAKP